MRQKQQLVLLAVAVGLLCGGSGEFLPHNDTLPQPHPTAALRGGGTHTAANLNARIAHNNNSNNSNNQHVGPGAHNRRHSGPAAVVNQTERLIKKLLRQHAIPAPHYLDYEDPRPLPLPKKRPNATRVVEKSASLRRLWYYRVPINNCPSLNRYYLALRPCLARTVPRMAARCNRCHHVHLKYTTP